MEEIYTPSKMEHLLEKQSAELKEYISLKLKPIEDQTTKTNGRVGAAEGNITTIQKWQARHDGAQRVVLVVSTLLFGVLIGYLTWLSLQVVAIPNTVKSAVDDSFSDRIESVYAE